MPAFPTPAPIEASLDLAVADVSVAASERTDTVVEVRPRNPADDRDVQAAEQTKVELADGVLTVRMPKKQLYLFGKPGAVDIAVALPEGSRLRVRTALGSVRCTGQLGDTHIRSATGDLGLEHAGACDIGTGSGRIVLDSADGNARIRTSSGTVDVGHVRGNAVVKNSSGDSRIGRVDGTLQASNASGHIAVGHAGSDVTASTAMGNVRLEHVVAGTVEVKTAAGDLHVGIAAGTAAWLDLHTSFGNVRNALDEAAGPGSGERRVEIKARTAMGDIDIVRSPDTTRE